MAVATWLLVLVDAAVLLAAVAVVVYLHRRGGDRGTADPAEWSQEARELAADVRRTTGSIDRPADRDEVSRRLLPLAARIAGHVRAAPSSVDGARLRAVFELGVSCERVATDVETGKAAIDGPFLEDRLDSLGATARSLEDRLGDD